MMTFIAMVVRAPHIVIEATSHAERPLRKGMLGKPENESTIKEKTGGRMIELIVMTRAAGMKNIERENTKKASKRVMKPRI